MKAWRIRSSSLQAAPAAVSGAFPKKCNLLTNQRRCGALQGFYLVRRSPGTLRIALSGNIGSESVLLPVRTGAGVFSLPVNLSGSLITILRTSGDFAVDSGPNANSADILTFEEPTTG